MDYGEEEPYDTNVYMLEPCCFFCTKKHIVVCCEPYAQRLKENIPLYMGTPVIDDI